MAIIAKISRAGFVGSSFCVCAVAAGMRGDSGIDPTAKEAYLSDAEFEKVGGWAGGQCERVLAQCRYAG